MTRDDVHPPPLAVHRAVATALAEDILPIGDLTASLLPRTVRSSAHFIARASGVVAGMDCVIEVCAQIDPTLVVEVVVDDGGEIESGGLIARLSGPTASMLTAERTALNFLCHLSGIASATNRYVKVARAANPSVRIWDTRKTTPGLRSLEKAAVRAGGGWNHRASLSEGVLIKDNHLGDLSIVEAVHLALARWPGRMVEVECDRVDQVGEALDAGASVVLLDNMTPSQVEGCVGFIRSHPRGSAGAVLVEASGGISLHNLAEYARTGVDLISIGAMTHSAPVLDIGLDLEDQ